MAKAKTYDQQTNSFVAGLITEATELTFPKNATFDESNCILSAKGNRTRRLGLDFQSSFVLSSSIGTSEDLESFAINYYSWSGVSEISSLNYFVIQIGNILHFYDYGITPLSNGKKAFTIDLDNFLAPEATLSNDTRISFTSGRGDLFIVSSKINPIKITYSLDSDSLSTEEIEIKIRDFEGIDDGLEVDERIASISIAHRYNLQNQGWYTSISGYDPIGAYKTNYALYPANNVQWTFSKNADTGKLDFTFMDTLAVGTSQAPKGHFILNAFFKDRASASGIGGLATETITVRPSGVGFFAGRVVYTLNSNVYISEVLNNSRNNVGKCYQDADPTSEEISDLLATDGLLITIPEAHNIKAVFELEDTLFLFAENGVWALSGTDGGFKTTDFTISKISPAGILGSTNVIDVEGFPTWLSETGAYTVTRDQTLGTNQVTSLTENSIKSFYNAIDPVSLLNSTGAYDKATGRIIWFYKGTEAPDFTSPHYYNKALIFDIALKAFYPWTLSQLDEFSPFICGIAITPSVNLGDTTLDVSLENGDNVILTNGDEITTNANEKLGLSTFFQYLTLVPTINDSTNKITFSDFTNNTFTDWDVQGIILDAAIGGTNYDSYLETGWDLKEDILRFKQNPYIVVHCKRTETGIDIEEGQDPTFTNPSGLFLRHKWDWTSGSQSGKWTTKQKAYRLNPFYFPETDDADWDNGFRLTTTKLRIRGSGRALQLRFDSEDGKDFDIIGWGSVFTGDTEL